MKNDFEKNSFILLILTTFASGINYLCQIMMGRFLPVDAFGVINTIFSFTVVAGVLGNSLNQLATKNVAENSDNKSIIQATIVFSLKVVFWCSVIFFMFFLLANPLIQKILAVDSQLVIWLTFIVISLTYISMVFSGVLAGFKKFIYVGVISLIIPMFKFAGVISATLAGNSTSQTNIIIGALAIGASAAIAISYILLRRSGLKYDSAAPKAQLHNEFGKTGIAILIINICFTYFSNADILLINGILGSEDSGIYSSAMLFGRIIFYFVTAVVTVMLPMVATENKKGNNPIRYLKKACGYTALLSALFFLPLNIFPSFFIGIIYGARYTGAAAFIPYACIIALLLSFLNIFTNYHVGIGKYRVLLAAYGLGTVVLTIITTTITLNTQQILLVIIMILALLLLVNIASSLKLKGTKLNEG